MHVNIFKIYTDVYLNINDNNNNIHSPHTFILDAINHD